MGAHKRKRFSVLLMFMSDKASAVLIGGDKKHMSKKQNRVAAVLSVIILIAMFTFGVLIVRERDAQFEAYAEANNCKWIYQGTAYGDDRDFICK